MDGAFAVQVVIDCESPHVLADWWAATLGWAVEPQDESFIRSMIAQGHASDAETTTHNGALVWAAGAAVCAPEKSDGQPRLLFQKVPEAKTAKNRVHLDLRPPESVDRAAMRQRLLERGAAEVGGGSQGPHTWVTFTDPEGNEFCVDA